LGGRANPSDSLFDSARGLAYNASGSSATLSQADVGSKESSMEYRYLSSTGVKVSALCLGCLTFGRELDETTSTSLIDRYLDAGGNFLDTANVYSRGRSEEIVGRAIRAHRDDIFLATKVRMRMGEGVNEVGLSRKHIMAQVEGSLRRLQTDTIDLYYVHCWDVAVDLEQMLRTMDDLIRAGKVRYWGISNFTGWQIALAAAACSYEGLARPVALQPQYSMIVRDAEREVLPAAAAFDLAIVPWSPLARGLLAGKYQPGESPPAESRIGRRHSWLDHWDRWDHERTWRIVDAVGEIAGARGVTCAQVALNWLLCQTGVTAPIVGVTSLDQLEENLGAVGWALTAEELDDLEVASAFDVGYPYEFIQRVSEDR
jgi:aryl-alcohol dehydrogenase-like predicted oxidoreductase